MKEKKIKNPLGRRVFRELRDEWQKYLVIAIFLTLIIGFVSGMYVANNSMLTSNDEAIDSNRQEDGHFILKNRADDDLVRAIESGKKADLKAYLPKEAYDKAAEAYDLNKSSEVVPVTVYEDFFYNLKETRFRRDNGEDKDNKGDIRVYKVRNDINKAELMEGRMPRTENEIAVDRMHASNVNIHVGDWIRAGGQKYKVTGLMSSIDYSTMFEDNNDIMFDAIGFDVGLVTGKGFDRLRDEGSIKYNYGFLYAEEAGDGKLHRAGDQVQEKKWSDSFLKALLTQVTVSDSSSEIADYMPNYQNQAIHFTTDDMGSDMAMAGVILYILIAVMAFIFAITTSNTITREAPVIGTLRASGYSRGELLRHYITMPVTVTVLAAVLGNILGYTVFKNVVVGMYYNSYSLMPYKTIWTPDAFVNTTVIPLILMFLINLIVISVKLRHSPLDFLRRDLRKSKKARAVRLPHWKFMNRFRLRVLLQNKAGYLVIFLGVFFVMLMLSMAVGMPETLDHYQANAGKMMLASHQVILTDYRDENDQVLTTDTASAEKFALTELKHTDESAGHEEDVSVYSLQKDSDYVKGIGDLKDNEVLISESFADKFGLSEGDKLSLPEKYEDKTHHFLVAGTVSTAGSLAAYMPISAFRTEFDMDPAAFSGYMANEKISGIPSKYVAQEITPRSITKMTDQLDHSMGSYMLYFQYLCVILAAVLLFLMTKLIIERNEKSISMTKILGYTNGEIASIYLVSTTIAVVLSELVGELLAVQVVRKLWRLVMLRMDGYFGFVMSGGGYLKMFILVFIGYLIVMFLDFRRIRRIPMDEAIKNME